METWESLESFAVETSDGVVLRGRATGPRSGPLVVALHGYPELAYGWRHQLPMLGRAGFRALAFDQRGYNLSGKPPAVADYGIERLAADVLEVIAQQRCAQAVVLGHDWGGVVAWQLALVHPEALAGVVFANIPHPGVFQRALRTARQARRSWYMAAMQVPWLPETLFGPRLMLRGMQRLLQVPMSEEDEQVYLHSYAQPGARRSMIHWYRAGLRSPPTPPPSPDTEVPALYLWGERDLALGLELLAPSAAHCAEVEVVRFAEAGHFVAHDAADGVNEALTRWLGSPDQARWASCRPR